MEELLKKILKPLKNIEPSSGFLMRSRPSILMAPQRVVRKLRFFEGVSVRMAFTFATIILVVVLGSVSYLNVEKSRLASSFNDKDLIEEATSLNFSFQIKEADYFNESAKQVALALEEISNDESSN